MRVEQLAAEAGVSVDTVRYYQNKGLLEPPRRQGRVAWYGPDHLHRLERIRTLQQRGFTLATIARLISGELDAADEALVAELSGTTEVSDRTAGASGKAAGRRSGRARGMAVNPDEPDEPWTPEPPEDGRSSEDELRLTLDDLADRTGVPMALLKAVEAEGLLIPRRFGDRQYYTGEDVEAAGAGLLLLEWGVPLSDLLDLSRRQHAATQAVAEEAVTLFSTHVRGTLRNHLGDDGRPGLGSESEAAALVQAYAELLPAVNALVGHHFTRALLKAAFDHIEQVGSDIERQAVWAEAGTVLTDGPLPTVDDPAGVSGPTATAESVGIRNPSGNGSVVS